MVLSKRLAFLLRHDAVRRGLPVRPDGYVLLELVLAQTDLFAGVDRAQVERVVANNGKQRFALAVLDDGRVYVRANQGHSHGVGGQLDETELLLPLELPQPSCVHATYAKCLPAIQAEGLRVMGRTHIHLCPPGREAEMTRPSADVWIHVDVARAMADGIPFFRSANGVVLTSGIGGVLPPCYFLRVENRTADR